MTGAPGLMWNRILINTKRLKKMGFIASIQNKIKGEKTRKKTLKFKTTLQCDGCVNKVKPHLNSISQIESWEVNLQHSKKILKAVIPYHSKDETIQSVMQALEKEGYKAEPMN
jgi:copper chaperone